MNILGLIPARGGSKSIPRKNIAKIAGRPLLAYACDAARGSQLMTRIIVSTDDEEIALIAKACGVDVPFLRPEELSRDDTPAFPVVEHAVRWLVKNENYRPDVIVLLQPTSPLRSKEHIDSALNILLASDADSIVSVVEIPHQYRPISAMKLDAGLLKPYLDGENGGALRRQEKHVVYARNGPAILAVRSEVIDQGSLYGDRILPYIMELSDSIDIDTPFDLKVAEYLLRELI